MGLILYKSEDRNDKAKRHSVCWHYAAPNRVQAPKCQKRGCSFSLDLCFSKEKQMEKSSSGYHSRTETNDHFPSLSERMHGSNARNGE